MRDEIRQLQSAQSDLLQEHIRELQEENSWLVSHYGAHPAMMWLLPRRVAVTALSVVSAAALLHVANLPTALHTVPIICLGLWPPPSSHLCIPSIGFSPPPGSVRRA